MGGSKGERVRERRRVFVDVRERETELKSKSFVQGARLEL